MARRVGKWVCPTCGNKDNDGMSRKCGAIGCGAPRPHNVVFYLPDDAQVITDQSVLARTGKPDWACEHCSAANNYFDDICAQCGAPKGSSPHNEVIEYSLEEVPRTAEDAQGIQEQPAQHTYSSAVHDPDSIKTETSSRPMQTRSSAHSFQSPQISAEWLKSIGILGILLAILFTGYMIFRQYDVQVEIQGFEWSRVIYVEMYRTVQEEDWDIPPGGRYVSQRKAFHHNVQVLDHHEEKTETYQCGSTQTRCGSRSNGDGTFDDIMCSEPKYCERTVSVPVYRDEPVYQTKYTYDIDKWVSHRSIPTQGKTRSDPPPYWGELVLNCAGQEQIGCERERNRTEVYEVHFVDQDEKTYEYAISQADWESFGDNQIYTITVNSLGQIMNDPLRPE